MFGGSKRVYGALGRVTCFQYTTGGKNSSRNDITIQEVAVLSFIDGINLLCLADMCHNSSNDAFAGDTSRTVI